ncbi:hypothetical protein Q7P35_005723 [Cladosporium inversicolor]
MSDGVHPTDHSAEAIITLGGHGIARIIAHVCVPHSQVTDWGVLISGDTLDTTSSSPLSPKSPKDQAKSAQAVLITIKPQRQAGQTVRLSRVYAKNVTLHDCLSERPYTPYCPTARRAAFQFVCNTLRPITLPWPA